MRLPSQVFRAELQAEDTLGVPGTGDLSWSCTEPGTASRLGVVPVSMGLLQKLSLPGHKVCRDGARHEGQVVP